LAHPALAQNTALVMDSEPGDYIGGGLNYYYTPADGTFAAGRNFDNGVDLTFNNGSHNWRVSFAAPDGVPLTVQVYNNASRYPFQGPGEPGLDISGDGRGCNDLAGSFEVREIVYGSGNTIVAFHATFVQHCEGGGPALIGEVLYFSSHPIPPLNHITSNLTAFGTRNQPFQYQIRASNHPTSFTATGLPAGLSVDAGSGLVSGTPTQEGHFPVELTATGMGATASGTLDLTINPPSQSTGPYTALSMSSDPGDWVGQGQNYLYRQIDGNFSANNFLLNSVNLFFSNASHDWGLSFDSPSGTIMGTGTYFGATRSVSAANPGIDIGGDGRGCNGTTGIFEVKEVTFVNGNMTAYRGTFLQHCDGGPALRGEVWFNSPRAITSDPRPLVTRGQPFSYQIVGNNAPTSFGASALPPGTVIDTTTGIIFGSPTMGGKFSIPVTATGATDTASDRITLVVGVPVEPEPAPVITSVPEATGRINQAFNYQITAANIPMQFAASGLPAGLAVNPNTGLISGAPAVTGTFDVIISASNSGGTGGSSLTLSIHPPPPVITSANTAGAVRLQPFSFQVTASNQPTGFSMDGQPSGLKLHATNGLLSGTPTSGGTFNMILRATNGSGTTFQNFTLTVATGSPTPSPSATAPPPTPTPTPPVTPTPSPSATPAAQAVNLSTRMRVQTGDNVGIGGFIITGTGSKNVLLRSLGPSLNQLGVPDALPDPVLELHGPGGFVSIANNNWRDDPLQQALILATGLAPGNNLDSAVFATLNPGSYTVVIRGSNNTRGVALIEVYDLSTAGSSKLANISTRAFVSTGDDIVIAGFILGSHIGDDRIVVRGIGPSLGVFGVPDTLANPTLELRNSDGALVMGNNDWQEDPAQAAELIAAGLAPSSPLESGIAATLPPGLYTALLAGMNNGTGNGVVEVYDRGAP
jgi:Putative Ig domain